MTIYDTCPCCGAELKTEKHLVDKSLINIFNLNKIGLSKVRWYLEILNDLPAYTNKKVTARITECGVIRK